MNSKFKRGLFGSVALFVLGFNVMFAGDTVAVQIDCGGNGSYVVDSDNPLIVTVKDCWGKTPCKTWTGWAWTAKKWCDNASAA